MLKIIESPLTGTTQLKIAKNFQQLQATIYKYFYQLNCSRVRPGRVFALIGQNLTAQSMVKVNGHCVTRACSVEIQTAASSGSSLSFAVGIRGAWREPLLAG